MHEIDDPLIEIDVFHDRIFLLGVDQLLRGGCIAGFEYQLLFLHEVLWRKWPKTAVFRDFEVIFGEEDMMEIPPFFFSELEISSPK